MVWPMSKSHRHLRRHHQVIAGELYRQIANVLKRPARVFIAPFDVRLPKENERDDLVDTVVQPDVFIVCDPTKIDMRGCRGGPDWLVEVLSPSTSRYDRFKKIPVYERAGVREVWLIQPKDRTVSYLFTRGTAAMGSRPFPSSKGERH